MAVVPGDVDVAQIESHRPGDHTVRCCVEWFDGGEPIGDAARVFGPLSDEEPHDLSHSSAIEVVDERDDRAWLIGREVDDHVESLGGSHLDVIVLYRLG